MREEIEAALSIEVIKHFDSGCVVRQTDGGAERFFIRRENHPDFAIGATRDEAESNLTAMIATDRARGNGHGRKK